MQKFYVIQRKDLPLYFTAMSTDLHSRAGWSTEINNAYFYSSVKDLEFGIGHNPYLKNNCKIVEVTMFTRDYIPNA